MRLSDFKFKLPEELIAQFPSRFRDEARMLVLHAKTGEIEHKLVSDLAAYFASACSGHQRDDGSSYEGQHSVYDDGERCRNPASFCKSEGPLAFLP